MEPERKEVDSALRGRFREFSPARRPFLWLFCSLAFSWWILVYCLFPLLWYPPKVGPLGRFAIFYALVVVGAIPVSVALVWVGRRIRVLRVRVWLAVATPALLWAALLTWGTHLMDRIHLSVIGAQVVVAVYFLTLAGIVVVLERRWQTSKVAIRTSLGILFLSQIACYSIEVWRLTLHRQEDWYGAVLLEHDLFSAWTFVVGVVAALLAVVALRVLRKKGRTISPTVRAGYTVDGPEPQNVHNRDISPNLDCDCTGLVPLAVPLYVGLALASSAIIWMLKSVARTSPMWLAAGVVVLVVLTCLVCWRLALVWGGPQELLSVRWTGQRRSILALLLAGVPIFITAVWLWMTTEISDGHVLPLAILPAVRLVSTVGSVVLTQGFLVGMLVREQRGPWFTIGVAAATGGVAQLLGLVLFNHAILVELLTEWGLLEVILSVALLAWMTLKLGSIIPVALFSWLTWMGAHYVWKIAFQQPPENPDTIGLWLLAACVPVVVVGIGMCAVKPFAGTGAREVGYSKGRVRSDQAFDEDPRLQ